MTAPIRTTADLTPAGILGYAKAIAAFIAAVLVSVIPFLPVDGQWERYAQAGIALLGVISVYAVPNAVRAIPGPGVDLTP